MAPDASHQPDHFTRWQFVVLLLLCLLTLFFFSRFSAFHGLGPQRLHNPDFHKGLNGWQLQRGSGSIGTLGPQLTISSKRGDSNLGISQCFSADALPQQLWLEVEMRVDRVIPGRLDWHHARIDLIGYDAKGRGIYDGHGFAGSSGSHDWRQLEGLFQLPQQAERVCLEIYLYHSRGSFEVRNLSLREAEANWFYPPLRGVLLLAWVVIGVWLLHSLLSYQREEGLGWWICGLLLVSLLGILMPQEIKLWLELQIEGVARLFGLALQASSSRHLNHISLLPAQWSIAKLGHLLSFFLISSALFARGRFAPLNLFAVLFLLAVASELLQMFVPGRSSNLADVSVDMIGVLLGWALVSSLRRFSFR
ncbi:VanZ like family [endosymbiont of Ridgeia piscesae]|jgi:hypothetical protein|uniref:VanZ like family n=3 Tax=endosymbiont of Ridgeia piscesae TaxID=54398 RepID=A0A0T5YVU9_9GAMM|nr:VanZ family protein [endosymbiont of Ridgeia piscesae]KRT54722.1 VanZ like family [endosymbiont of Ridgeia piscesae]